jgi:hypothetical protein
VNKHLSTDPKKARRRKIIVVSAIVGTLAAPAAAWAAVALFGFGSFSSAATTTQNLTIVGTPTTTGPLAPGETVGVKGDVKNPNGFPVKVTGIIVRKGSETTTGGTPAECDISLHPRGTTVDFPGDSNATPSTSTVANGGTQFTLASAVTIAPNATVTITVADVIKQNASATKLCGVGAEYAVRAIVGSE